MSVLSRLSPHPRARQKIRRVGRGPGSGRGKTSGRGHKGQKQHNRPPRPGFEGGQMPLVRTTPKRGMTAESKPRYQIVNLRDLQRLSAAEGMVDAPRLYAEGLLGTRRMPVKILGEGDIQKAIQVKVHALSRSARAKIEKAGGRWEIVTG